MANTHFGNLADVFKHLALAEVLRLVRPAEYWESHAGNALYHETDPIPPDRRHGIHTFFHLAAHNLDLQTTAYGRILGRLAAGPGLTRIPGSPWIARRLQSDNLRRLLFCDTDASSLKTLRELLPAGADGQKDIPSDNIECVQDDGVSILRGAGMLLPEPWTASTLAFLDPYEMCAPTDAEITPLDLACELGNRGIVTLLFYTFADDGSRVLQHDRMLKTLEKTRLLHRGGHWFEGSLKADPKAGPPATQWGFGLLTLNVRAEPLAAIDARLRALECAYEKSDVLLPGGPIMGAWRYARATI